MPLVSIQLEEAIKSKLRQELTSKQTKLELCKKLDGGPLAGALSGAENITDALENIQDRTENISANTPDIEGSDTVSAELIKKVASNEWASAISDAVYQWIDEDIVPILANVIANEVTTYIKSATIIVQPGITVTTPAGPGVTSTPSTPATIN